VEVAVEPVNRRTLLRGGVGLAAGAALSGPLQLLGAQVAGASRTTAAAKPVPGLQPVADLRDGVARLSLLPGFSYRSFHDTSAGATLSDLTPLPGRHDGMAAFAAADGAVGLIRNHEINGPGDPFSTAAPTYDVAARGGTTTTLVDSQATVLHAFASLAGTQMNCAGGRMPWGAWVTCEETVNGFDVFDDFTRGSAPPETYVQNVFLEQRHGFIFEVPLDGVASAQPITAAGRFPHEAVAYDPREGALYLTEDDFGFPSGFYKYVPPVHPSEVGRIEDGGQLYMAAIRDRPNLDMSASGIRGRLHVQWVPIADPAPTYPMVDGLPTTTNDAAITHVARQGWDQGAAYFSRLEGAVIDKGTIYFSSTQGGGPAEDPDISTPRPTGYGMGFGQIWAYDVRAERLALVFESPGREVLDFPDNLTVSPQGRVVICEDSSQGNFLRVLDRRGRLVDVAQNIIPGRVDDEFAGACFSPGGSTLYVNIQASNGLTFAIFGDWRGIG
jgi:uncharacterized protein